MNLPRTGLFVYLIVCAFVGYTKCAEYEYGGNDYNDDNSSNDNYVDNSIDLERTGISNAEKLLKALVIPLNILGNGVRDFFSKIPGVNRIIPPAGEGRSGGVGELLNKVKDKFKAVYPGTYWCGAGAVSDDSLGLFKKTDACCKEHDNCQQNILTGEQRGRLINNGLFTRSSCDCDSKFYSCLLKVNSVISHKIGVTYFNILRPQCFSNEYPVTGCASKGKAILGERKCEEYTFDYGKQKSLQWFDNPDFPIVGKQ
ncbi:phospholipase A2-like [Prorops nasuta]|uniref:phospholipase A2-like n=1 Tax=Prorops nasuta TaxID=863751 RepID=UPI0034CED79D